MVPSPELSLRDALSCARGRRPTVQGIAEALVRCQWMHQLTPEEGPIRRLFADHGALHDHAMEQDGLANGGYTEVVKPWFQGLGELLAGGCDAAVLDAGGEVEIELERRDLVAIVSALALARIERDAELFVLLQDDRVYYHVSANGERCAFAFTTRQAAEDRLPAMRETVPDLCTGPLATELVCEGLLRSDAKRLFLDPGLPGQETMEREVLEVLRATWSGAAPCVSAPTAPTLPTAPSAPLRPAPEPARSTDADAGEHVRRVRSMIASPTPWAGIARLLDDFPMWIPVDNQAREWPELERVRDASGGEIVRASIYSSEARALTAFAVRGLREPELTSLPAGQALRWIWASPCEAGQVQVDPDGPEGPLLLTERDVLAAFFPSVLPLPDLDQVPELPVERFCELPRLHGLAPEVMRTLASSPLFGFPLDGALVTVPLTDTNEREGAYLPVFTSTERHLAYARTCPGRREAPVAFDASPFLSFLRAAMRCDGVVVDPESPHALVLDHWELFFLHLWTTERRTPDGGLVSKTLGELLCEAPIDQRTAGRIVAEWPFFLAARFVDEPHSGLVAVPNTDDLALFTSERALADFTRVHQRNGSLTRELQPVHLLPRLRRSVFDVAHERFSGVCIDAETTSEGRGIRLDGKGLDGALERLEEKLAPGRRRSA